MNVRLAGDIQERFRLLKRGNTMIPALKDSTVEDPTEIAQSQSEDDEGISSHVLEEKPPQAVE